MTRVEFLRYLGAGCVFAALGTVTGCSTIPVHRTQLRGGRALVSEAEFDMLLENKDENAVLVRLDSIDEAVILVRTDAHAYRALSAVCTHQGCEVRYGKGRIRCPCHGSTFTIKGEVSRGPAPRPLPLYGVTVSEGMIEIDLTRNLQEVQS